MLAGQRVTVGPGKLNKRPREPVPPLSFDLRSKRVGVAGHNGMAGLALIVRLAGKGCELLAVSRQALDLTQQSNTNDWLGQMQPDAVLLATGHGGGIFANDTRLHDGLATAYADFRAGAVAGRQPGD